MMNLNYTTDDPNLHFVMPTIHYIMWDESIV